MITDELRTFLTSIDTAFLATTDRDGQPYVQHRGGPKGFIRALDDATLAFLDLAGNRQYLTVGNLAENAKVCLFLMDYARRRRVKVWGTAHVKALTPELRELLGPVQRGRAERVIAIDVARWDVNCPAHIPQKLDARDVADAIASLESRIALLESENARLRADQAGG